MKRYTAFVFISFLMFGLSKAAATDYGDLTPGDIAEIENGQNNSGDTTTPPPPPTDEQGSSDEVLDPVLCNGTVHKTVGTSQCIQLIANSSKLSVLNDGSSVINFTGNLKGKSGHIVAIQNATGNIFLLGIGNAYVESVSNTKGNLTICNMDVGTISNISTGNISIDGGNVCTVSGHKGNIKVNNGSIGEVDGNTGNIEVTNGNIGNIDSHTGNIHVKNGSITGTVTNSIGNIKVN